MLTAVASIHVRDDLAMMWIKIRDHVCVGDHVIAGSNTQISHAKFRGCGASASLVS